MDFNTNITIKDNQLLLGIAHTGFITTSLLSSTDISCKTLNKLINNKLIKRDGLFMIFGALNHVHTLTPKGKQYVSSSLLTNCYKSDKSQLEHDYILSKLYWSISNSERNNWLNETELKSKFRNALITCDAIYISNGLTIGVEVITDSYTQEAIDEKKEFMKSCCDRSIILSTNLKKCLRENGDS